jgi:Type II secretion system (T2SS), protein G
MLKNGKMGLGTDGVKPKFMIKSQWQISDRFIVMLVVAFGISFLVMQILPMLAGGGPAKVPRARSDERQLLLSMEICKQEFGSYPTGENATIMKLLAGDNAKKMKFINLGILSTNAAGQFVDPWKIPYKIISDGTNCVIITSAGIDQKFGNADDIIFNSVSNDFVKP